MFFGFGVAFAVFSASANAQVADADPHAGHVHAADAQMGEAHTGNAHSGHVHPAASGGSFFSDLFRVYTPRQLCMFQERPVIWLHLVSDFSIGAAYFSIPLALIAIIRRRQDLAFHWMFWMFAGFIVACGTTHFFGVIDLWRPYYRVDGIIKAITAALSIATAIALWPLIPKIVALPSPAQLELRVRERTSQLTDVNAALRREAEARQLAEADQARLASIVEHSEDAIIGKRLDGTITSWNRAAERLFGYSASEMVGQSIYRIVPENRRDEEANAITTTSNGDAVTAIETVRRAKDGRQIDVLLTVSPMRDRDGTIIGASKILRDITPQREHAREREQLLASERLARFESDRASRMKDEFLATVSHELRTPLTAMLGWTQILRRNPHGDALLEGLQTIERNARAQAKLVEDLLDVSRIISGKLNLEISEVDLAAVINDVVISVEPAAVSKEIRLQKILDPNVPLIAGDSSRLQQIIWNLLNNAVKFTPRGGRVQIFLERDNDQMIISVTDTGEGMSAEFVPHLFERFRQADSSITRRHGGLGIGLAIVRHLVELHGGRVKATSPGNGQGSTFTVSIPIRASGAVKSTASPGNHTDLPNAQNLADIRFDGLRVLVVDDERDASDIVRRVLEPLGASVSSAISASEGFDLVQRISPQVLLCDIGMPDEDGYSLLRRVRKLSPQQGGDVPAIAVTAFARAEDQQHAIIAGFQLHLAKPFEAEQLIASIARMTERLV